MRGKNRNFPQKFVWFVSITILAYLSFWFSPLAAEWVYGKGLYTLGRIVFDYTIGWVNLPVIYLVLLGLLLVIARWIFNFRKERGALNLFMGIVTFVLLFFWMWGFNYFRPNVKVKLGLSIPAANVQVVEEMFCRLVDKLPVWREQMNSNLSKSELEALVRTNTSQMLRTIQLNAPGRPRIRHLYPEGVLLGTSTAGIFLPYSFEAHIDAGLHPLVWPFVMSHEVSHAFGITDEGECNFLACLTCRFSESPYLSYSGGLFELRYLYSALRRAGYENEQLRSEISELILKDLNEINQKHDSFPDYFPEAWRNWIYDGYLKAQGVKSGLNSYGEVLGLLVAWEERSLPTETHR